MKPKSIQIAIIILTVLISTSCLNKKISRADKYYEAGEYFKASEKYKKLQAKKRIDKRRKSELYFKLGECYRHMNMIVDAERWYRKAVTKKHKNPEATLYLAEMLRTNGKLEKAKERYSQYLELVPDDKRGQNGLKSCDIIAKWQKEESPYIVENKKVFNSRQSDFAPCFAKEDKTVIYFTSAREAGKGDKINNVSGMKFTDIYYSRQDRAGVWSTPSPINDTINSKADEGACTFNNKFSALYFTRCKVEKTGNMGCKIYKVTRKGGEWGKTEQINLVGDSSITVGHPSLSEDELTMIFAADLSTVEKYRETAKGGNDLWIAKRKSKTYPWEDIRNMGAEINTPGEELYPYIYNDTTIYFSSNYHLGMGGLDIFKATKNGSDMWKIENMKAPLNSIADDFGIIINKEDGSGYFTSARKGGMGEDDIYGFSLPPLEFSMTGVVIDEETEQTLDSVKVSMVGSNGTSFEKITQKDGAFNFKLRKGTDYVLSTDRIKYFRGKAKATTKGLKESKILDLKIIMSPIPEDSVGIEIPNIVYDFNRWELRAESMFALDKLVNLLKENPRIAIELGSHTDFRGSEVDNDTLSHKRAQSVIDYLVKRRIDPGRLVAKGYGEKAPKKVNAEIAKKYPYLPEGVILNENFITKTLQNDEQREVAHQLNRRTEFKVLTTEYRPGIKIETSPNDK